MSEEARIHEVQGSDGWWVVGATRDDGESRRCDLPPDSSPQLREEAGRMCADELAHAATG